MENHIIKLQYDAAMVNELSTTCTIGALSHAHSFSWAPSQTPTNGGDRFFAVPIQSASAIEADK